MLIVFSFQQCGRIMDTTEVSDVLYMVGLLNWPCH